MTNFVSFHDEVLINKYGAFGNDWMMMYVKVKAVKKVASNSLIRFIFAAKVLLMCIEIWENWI